MFYKIITGDRFATVFIIFLIALGIWMPVFLFPGDITGLAAETPMPLYGLLNEVLKNQLLLSEIVTFLLLLLEAILLVRINAKFVLVQQKTFLPALFFIILAGHSPELLQWNPVLPAALFVILSLEIIFRSYGDEPNSYKIFEAGILMGIGSLFYAPLIYFLIFIWIACMVQRPFYWREFLFPVIGMVVPYIFVVAFLFFGNKSIPDFLVSFKSQFIFSFDLPQFNWIYLSFSGFVVLLVLMASVYLLKVFQFRKIYIRDYFMVLFWLFISGSFVFLLLSGFNKGLTYIVAIPIAFILTNYFINAKKSPGNKILLYILLGYALLLALYNLTGKIWMQ